MTNYARSQEEASQFTTRILCDTISPQPLDACYIVGETKDNQDSGIEGAVDCYSKTYCKAIIICTGHTRHGYAGAEYIREVLHKKGFSGPVLDFGITEKDFNTYTEMEALIRFAKSKYLKSLYIVAPEFHLVRAFATAVSCAVKFYPELKLYARRGASLSWQSLVKHSQGILTETRSKLLLSEWIRIGLYSQKGDILFIDKILNYLNDRDK